MRLRTTFLWSMIGSLSLAALLGIVALLLPDLIGKDEEILLSTLLFAIYSLLALCCAIVAEKRRIVMLMWIGIGSSVISLLIWLVLIWLESNWSFRVRENVTQAGGTFSATATVIALSGLLALPRLDGFSANNLRRATIGVSVLLGACIVIMLWWHQWIYDNVKLDLVERGLGVLAILSACGTLVTPIVWKVQGIRRATVGESLPMHIRIEVVCPRCKTHQQLLAGPGKCENCKLRIKIIVEEPRCACGYQLYHLKSNNCPECGKEVPESDRWAAIPV
ncbi:MAG: hypothetical protein IH984_15620 [Planctomycetes bacterium]|nr:hypothetical protein [Planctomycetota bacterium]